MQEIKHVHAENTPHFHRFRTAFSPFSHHIFAANKPCNRLKNTLPPRNHDRIRRNRTTFTPQISLATAWKTHWNRRNAPRKRCFECEFCCFECGFHRFWTWVRRFLTLFSPVRVPVRQFRQMGNVDIMCWFAVKWRWERWNALWNSGNQDWKRPKRTTQPP